jgi:hypothetical protein
MLSPRTVIRLSYQLPAEARCTIAMWQPTVDTKYPTDRAMQQTRNAAELKDNIATGQCARRRASHTLEA